VTVAAKWETERRLLNSPLGASAKALGAAVLATAMPDGITPRCARHKIRTRALCQRAGISVRTFFRHVGELEATGLFRRDYEVTWCPRKRVPIRRLRLCVAAGHRVSAKMARQEHTDLPSTSVSDLSTGSRGRGADQRDERKQAIAGFGRLARSRTDLPQLRPCATPYAALCKRCGRAGHTAENCTL
jgi:AcrR family transcriptional regulator